MKKKRLLSMVMSLAIFVGSISLLPDMFWGENGAIVADAEQYRTNLTISKVSQVYIGEIIVDGESKIQYAYSPNYTCTYNTAFILNYSLADNNVGFDNTIVTRDIQFSTNSIGLKASTAYADEMNDEWRDSLYVAKKYYWGVLNEYSTTNSDLYDIDPKFKENIDEYNTSHTSNLYTFTNSNLMGHRLMNTISSTTSYSIIVSNGSVFNGYIIDKQDEVTDVYYTKTEVKTTPATLVKNEAIPATCTEDGNIEYWTLEDSRYFKDSEGRFEISIVDTIDKAGHKWTEPRTKAFDLIHNTSSIERSCSRCGETETTVVENAVSRLAGAGRYQTAVEISKAGFPNGANTVILAYGLNYADALAGVSLAKVVNAPILLTNLKTIPDETLAEIKRLEATNVVILGGEGAVSANVETVLRNEGLNIERLAGATRFETATMIAQRIQSIKFKAPEELFFVYAFNSADALSVSSVAAIKGAPVIYINPYGNLDNATASYLNSVKGAVKNAYVIGGTGVISDDMMKKAGDAVGVTPTRVFGKDRFATCVAVNEQFKDTLNGDMLCVATGMDFPDALAGGVYAAINKAPLFLINGKLKTPKLTDEQKAYLKTKAAAKITAFGGTGVVPDSHIIDIAMKSV